MAMMNLTLIYWFTSVGMMVGLVFALIMKKEGISYSGNIIWGAVGANIMGYIGISMQVGDGVFFSFLATIPFLFLVNVFHQHHQEDLFGEIHLAQIIKKKVKPKSDTD
jgi:hypothetical protein